LQAPFAWALYIIFTNTQRGSNHLNWVADWHNDDDYWPTLPRVTVTVIGQAKGRCVYAVSAIQLEWSLRCGHPMDTCANEVCTQSIIHAIIDTKQEGELPLSGSFTVPSEAAWKNKFVNAVKSCWQSKHWDLFFYIFPPTWPVKYNLFFSPSPKVCVSVFASGKTCSLHSFISSIKMFLFFQQHSLFLSFFDEVQISRGKKST